MRILSWNIQWGRGADGQVDLSRLAAALKAACPDPEVICLQEVAVNFPGLPGGARENCVAILAAAFPGYEAVFSPGPDVPDGAGGRSQFGNMVLSRLPVGQVFRHILPWPSDPAVPSMQRSCLEVVVDAPRGPLRIMTTHLEYYSRRQRLAQVEALRTLQGEAASHGLEPPTHDRDGVFTPRPRPVSAVLCGDFNFEPETPEHIRLTAPIDGLVPDWADAWSLVHPDQPHAPSVGLHGAEWPDRPFCCDFFFVTEDLVDRLQGIRVVADTAASDHQPVILEIDA
ncbi:MAG: endonuclease/exonuclease/phosphatase family protein [Rhodocyclaceae bacterium]|jgi:endonuclease/exonuclease/phosphatase family metal-dependent hydrolase|nr:endonuclease/exonuclease/phosphatase family protein [Rhodocyclaceae bacterium]